MHGPRIIVYAAVAATIASVAFLSTVGHHRMRAASKPAPETVAEQDDQPDLAVDDPLGLELLALQAKEQKK
jgi:hypothetical protein